MKTLGKLLAISFGASLFGSTLAKAEGTAKEMLKMVDRAGNLATITTLVISAYENGFAWANADLRGQKRPPLYCAPPRWR